MRAVGLVTEYNPFHNGHLHHLQESLRLADAEVAVAVMSGNFLQRGEPALVDKWVRTEMALAAGVDVVIELPLPWACNSAGRFAEGAILALQRFGGVGTLCFGSEAGNVEPLQRCSGFLEEQGDEIERRIRPLLRKGASYPAARAEVVAEMQGDSGFSLLLERPNDILGLAYLRAIRRFKAGIRPLTMRRRGAGYHETEVRQGIASATGIRRMIGQGESFEGLVPAEVGEILRAALQDGGGVDRQLLFRLVAARLLIGAGRRPPIYQLEPGVERLLCRVAQSAAALDQLLDEAKPRHLTRTRLQRLLCYLLLDLTDTEARACLDPGPLYLHLLGLSDRGVHFLAQQRKLRQVPLVQNFSRVHAQLARHYGKGSELLRRAFAQLDLETRATRIYTLLSARPWSGERNRDFSEELRRC